MNERLSRPATRALVAARLSVLCTALFAAACDAKPGPTTAEAGPQPQALPTIQVKVGPTLLTLQVADTGGTREKGLMFTRSMPADTGMVFVFPTEQPLTFWMENTPIDLDIAYLDHAGRIVSVKTMRAYDKTLVPSDEPATFAIELNAGTAARLHLTAGGHIDLPPGLVAHVQ